MPYQYTPNSARTELIRLALRYAFEILKADRVTLGVFDNNLPAYRCYKSAGFKDSEKEGAECMLMGDSVSGSRTADAVPIYAKQRQDPQQPDMYAPVPFQKSPHARLLYAPQRKFLFYQDF